MPSDHGEVTLTDVRVPADAVSSARSTTAWKSGRRSCTRTGSAGRRPAWALLQYRIDRAAEYAGQRVVSASCSGEPGRSGHWPKPQTEAQMVRLLVYYYAAWHLDRDHHMEVSDKVSMANYRANRLVRGRRPGDADPRRHRLQPARTVRSTSTGTTGATGITEGAEEIQIRRVAQRMPGSSAGNESGETTFRPGRGRGHRSAPAHRRRQSHHLRVPADGRRLILRTGPPDEVHAGDGTRAAVQRLAADHGRAGAR